MEIMPITYETHGWSSRFFNNMINWSVLSYRSRNHFSENNFINGPPIINTTINDVTTDNPALKGISKYV